MEPKNPLAQLKNSTESLYNRMNQTEDRNRLGGVGDKVKDLDQISKEQKFFFTNIEKKLTGNAAHHEKTKSSNYSWREKNAKLMV